MTSIEVVQQVRDLISDRSHWCAHHMALDNDGHPVSAYSDLACRWCISGAYEHVLGPETRTDYSTWGLIVRAARSLTNGRWGPVLVNDIEGHDMVMKVLDRAIDMAKENA